MADLRKEKKTKSVLVISTKDSELTTEFVMDWILFKKHQVERLNGDDISKSNTEIEISKTGLCVNNSKLKTVFDSIWFRRWGSTALFLNGIRNSLSSEIKDPDLLKSVIHYITLSHQSLKDYILQDYLKGKKWLTDFSQVDVKKLNVLSHAVSCSLNIPDFIVTDTKDSLFKFYKKMNKKIVVKDIDAPFANFIGADIFVSFTELLDEQKIHDLPDNFVISFFQEFIDKEFDIRTFYLNEKFYSMCIFSQKNEHTKIDFRKFSTKYPNRRVPFQLPKKLEDKLRILMKRLNLVTGSIDILKGKDNKYYFLEVNPVGQFGMVSRPCNYNLEEKVADFLIK